MRRALLLLALLACRNRHREQPKPVPEHAPVAPAATGACTGDAVKTADGCVRGKREGDATVFRGIPYAAPPVGALRWKLPQPPAKWDVRDAFAFGPSCPQLQSPLNAGLTANEDCLTLTVWSPAGAAKLPVMVWIHGGGLVAGGAAQPTYDGGHLAAAGKVVVVSINYRLGPLGFLAHPALSSGNLGIHDQLAALHWVQREIAGFGGDPASVTIFGESAGGESVCALMASPLAHGLFARAIIESAQCVGYGKALRPLHTGTPEGAEEQGLRVAKAAGCPGSDAAAAACLRGKSADELLRAAPPALGFLSKGEHYGLVVDGSLLPDAPAAALAAGKLADVPLIIGTTKDEATLFTTGLTLRRAAVYTAIVRKLFPGAADRILEIYAPDRFGSPKQAFDALVTDLVFACPARRTARTLVHHEVWRYLFTVARDPKLGATHGSELGFVFGTVKSPSAAEAALSQTMQGYWTRFAHTGDPGAGWPAYAPGRDTYLELATSAATARVEAGNPGCDVLDTLAPAADPPTDDQD